MDIEDVTGDSLSHYLLIFIFMFEHVMINLYPYIKTNKLNLNEFYFGIK
jgi:hypothetical protein